MFVGYLIIAARDNAQATALKKLEMLVVAPPGLCW
jgi:hypothetical protein